LLHGHERKKGIIFFSWLFGFFIFTIIITPEGSTERYQMTMLPALIILSAAVIEIYSRQLENKSLLKYAGLTLIFLLFFFILNSFGARQPFALIKPKWDLLLENPDIWYVGTSGPIFKIKLLPLAITFIGSLVLFLLILLLNFRQIRDSINKFCPLTKQGLIAILLILNLAFNLLLIGEFLFHFTSPDYSSTMANMVSYFREHNLNARIFSLNEDFAYYLDLGYYGYFDLESRKGLAELEKGGTVLWLNVGPGQNERARDAVQKQCKELARWEDKGYLTGIIYEC